ncbi:DUF1656 domain-containing protein [Escherichia coli]|uniref:DUF1656 domain-containing protein n=1 Tax=Escherichia coli TaxID=562 RepID=UPI0028527B66|nr:DUF1656 domain-containing protein [Escherichia coli]
MPDQNLVAIPISSPYIYFPPFFKAFAFGFVIWLVIHRLLRGWIYAGDIWHPLLMDLSLFAICVCLALAILIAW